MDIDEALLEAEEAMEKAAGYLKLELRGIRTGRASTALVEYVKIEVYGTQSDLRELAIISVPEPTQLLVKPFDPSTVQAVIKGLQSSGLGLNPVAEGKHVRMALPTLSGDRRNQLIGTVKQMGEQAKITVRNARRDANKHIDAAGKDKSLSLSEDVVDSGKDDVQRLVKKYESQVEKMVGAKVAEVQEV